MNSQAFRKFKEGMGQANHFLITIMVGLDAVEDGAQKRESFSMSWNPQDTKQSVVRSKRYAIKAALAWTVDNLDMYLRLCNREPRLYNDKESFEFAKTEHSIYKKLFCVIGNHNGLTPDKFAFVDLLICWRNNTIHFDAQNKLSTSSLNYLKNIPNEDIAVCKYHLDVSQMLERFERSDIPTMKETATLIAKTIQFVEELDNILLQNIQQYEFLETTLYKFLKCQNETTSIFDYKNTTPEKRKKKLKQLFATMGVSTDFYNQDGEKFLDEVIYLKEDEFIRRVNEHRSKKLEQ